MASVQMMLRSKSPPLSVSAANATNTVFLPEPAPITQSLNAGTVAVPVGGTGSYTYSWAFVSGSAAINVSGSTTNANCSWTGTVQKNTALTAVWRCTVNDGVNSATTNVTVRLEYTTNL